MKEIEVGEYVRTYEGIIGKIIDFDIDVGICIDNLKELLTIDAIVKPSKNIIDLIKVGDYVNLERILDITGEYIRTTETIYNRFWLSNNIKSIVTKEMFEQIKYIVKE